ncbi:PAS domain S-box protein [Natronolimnohabitans sp. A-GB9]|uniref:PAS domain S-box protein n=1 Tax=Natronolimnohabitans sp. A-GB9 TaxID=3069757 RepID=UPI0027AF8744|nr:PAS domain S-box protein [Natronolimnohabitans sp. A-GB9]MDQ2050030.1 PAS domain S-box protein [Natronolimnohabitans sp. A-GB9]
MTGDNDGGTSSSAHGNEDVVSRSPLDLDDATFFQTLAANTSEGLLTLDTESTIVYANPAVERILGYSPEELVGTSKMDLIPERLRSAHAEGLRRYLETGEKHFDWDGVELPALHKDGHEVPISISLREHEYDGQRLFTGIIRDITDQKAYEEKLQYERDTVQQLLETSPIGITVIDSKGEIVRANTYAGVLYDRSPDELRGESYESIDQKVVSVAEEPLSPEDHPITRVFVTGEPVYDTVIGIKPTAGKRTWLSVSAAPIRGPDGSIDRVITALEDVTERKQREQRLRAFREALDHAGHSIYLTDTDGTIEYVNAAFEEQTGYAVEEALGETPQILNSGEHDNPFYADLWETILSGETWTGEVINQRKSGETYTVNQTVAPITTADGDIERFIAVNVDVTEQKERERTITRQRNTLQQLLETSPSGIMVVDADGEITRINGRGREILDIHEERIDEYTPEDRPTYDEEGQPVPADEHPFAVALETGTVVEDRILKVERPDGESRWLSVSAAPVFDEDGTLDRVITTAEDITALEESKRTLAQQRDTLEHQRNTLERLHKIITSLNSIHHAIVRASTRDELEQQVCDSLGSSEAYAEAWIGEYVVADETVRPSAWAGLTEETLSDEVAAVNEADSRDGITKKALQSGDVQAVQNLSNNSMATMASGYAHRRGYNAAAAVPLTYRGTVYGVLRLHSDRAFAFDENERHLLGELGERIGHAIYATKNRQLLHAETRVELEFRCTDSDVPVIDVTEHLDCRLSLKKTTPASEGAFVYYIDVEGAPPEHVCDRLETFSGVDLARPLQATGDTGRIECRATSSSPVLTLIKEGVTPNSVVVEDGIGRIIGETAPETNIRPIIERLQATFPETEFVSKRTVTQSTAAENADSETVFESLTDRQQEVLEVAYHAGYFDSPRRASGEEIAETLGISSATFYQHVRKGSRKLLDELAADGSSATG